MIIECINCSKKFEVDPSLIPDLGREIQCGSCGHTWFFKKKRVISEKKINKSTITVQSEKINTSNVDRDNYEIDNSKNFENIKIENKKNLLSKKPIKSNFNISYIISILIVIIISFVGLIIILDTFKLQLINLFPSFELLLFNLFETLKDIFLFTKNLIL